MRPADRYEWALYISIAAGLSLLIAATYILWAGLL